MNWNYIAGFFDGEGSVVDNGDGLRIQITQADFKVLNEIKIFTGVGRVAALTKRKAHWKDSWLFYIARQKDVLFFLKNIHKRTIVKNRTIGAALPKLKLQLERRRAREARLRRRIELSKVLRGQGYTYREIGRRLQADHGYIRRLISRNS